MHASLEIISCYPSSLCLPPLSPINVLQDPACTAGMNKWSSKFNHGSQKPQQLRMPACGLLVPTSCSQCRFELTSLKDSSLRIPHPSLAGSGKRLRISKEGAREGVN